MRIVCWRAIIVSLVWVVKWAVSTSGSWVGIVVGVSSGKVRALILDDFLKYIVENGFGVIRVLHILRDAEDIATLADVVFNVLIITLVCKLSHFYSILAKKQGVRKELGRFCLVFLLTFLRQIVRLNRISRVTVEVNLWCRVEKQQPKARALVSQTEVELVWEVRAWFLKSCKD